MRGRYATAANPTPHHTATALVLCLTHTGPSPSDAIIEKHAASIRPFRRYSEQQRRSVTERGEEQRRAAGSRAWHAAVSDALPLAAAG